MDDSAVVRPWRADDAQALQRHANNRNIWLNLRDIFPHRYTIENAQGFLAFIAQEQPPATFAIATATEAIGCIGLRMGEDVHRRTAELGYWLGEAFWGRGIMTEAVSAFTKLAFENYRAQSYPRTLRHQYGIRAGVRKKLRFRISRGPVACSSL